MFGVIWPGLVQIWASSADFGGQIWPIMHHFGPSLVDVCTNWPKSGLMLANVGGFWLNSASDFAQIWTHLGQIEAEFGQLWPELVQSRPTLGQARARFGRGPGPTPEPFWGDFGLLPLRTRFLLKMLMWKGPDGRGPSREPVSGSLGPPLRKRFKFKVKTFMWKGPFWGPDGRGPSREPFFEFLKSSRARLSSAKLGQKVVVWASLGRNCEHLAESAPKLAEVGPGSAEHWLEFA